MFKIIFIQTNYEELRNTLKTWKVFVAYSYKGINAYPICQA
jgi:hypothetical protein